MGKRYAKISQRLIAPESVSQYLPGGYRVVGTDNDNIYIEGEDHAGWTLDGYVIPRLASGLIFAYEIDQLPDVEELSWVAKKEGEEDNGE